MLSTQKNVNYNIAKKVIIFNLLNQNVKKIKRQMNAGSQVCHKTDRLYLFTIILSWR